MKKQTREPPVKNPGQLVSVKKHRTISAKYSVKHFKTGRF
jgi:hypothetical protein